MVGATGFEPVTPSVSANHREPLCYPPFSQVTSDRRCERETLSDVQLNALLRHCPLRTRVAPHPALTHQCTRYEAVHLHPCISLDPDDRSHSPSRPARTEVTATVMSGVLDSIGQVGPAAQDMAMTVGPYRLG